jgi:sulfide dehydrogenase cytochrome subunit
MTTKNLKTTLFSTVAFSAMFFSCQKELSEKKSELPQTVSAGTATLDHPGRTLAANCFQCHGTDGFAGELKIATQSASSIINKFNSYRTKPANADIMYVHAYAYTNEEIKLIADYFSKQ